MRLKQTRIGVVFLLFLTTSFAEAQGIVQPDIRRPAGFDQKEAIQVNEHVYQATGFGNTYLVVTREGNVVIDTSSGVLAAAHKRLLKKVSDGPIRYVILTHCHPDHIGGIHAWRKEGTQIVAQEKYQSGREYQRRLAGLFVRRNSAQYNIAPALVQAAARQYLDPKFDATLTFDRSHTIKLGELTFELFHSPGETEDQLNVWIPEIQTAFIGDNMYETFPNMYTLRGTQPRWALDWIASLDHVIALEPAVLLGSHLPPITGKEAIRKHLVRYRDAIQYVHDETVRGMNEGKDVYTLMREITLPAELAMSEDYGRLTWSIRGIYEGYVGWFDENPVTMYETPASAVSADLVQLAGGADKIVDRAKGHVEAGRFVEAIHLLNVALEAEPTHRQSLEMKIHAYQSLLARATNVIEQGWLKHGIRETEAILRASP